MQDFPLSQPVHTPFIIFFIFTYQLIAIKVNFNHTGFFFSFCSSKFSYTIFQYCHILINYNVFVLAQYFWIKLQKKSLIFFKIERFQYYILHCPKCVFFFIITICTGKKNLRQSTDLVKLISHLLIPTPPPLNYHFE